MRDIGKTLWIFRDQISGLFIRMGAWIVFGVKVEGIADDMIPNIVEDVSPTFSSSSLLSPDFQSPCSNASTMEPITNGELVTADSTIGAKVKERLMSLARRGQL